MDLIRCQAVCKSWRGIIQNNDALWRAKVRDWDPAECTLLKDAMDYRLLFPRASYQHLPTMHESLNEYPPLAELDSLLNRIESRPGFIGWKEAVVQELVLKQNWKWGRYVHQLTTSLTMDVKPVLLAWPWLILVDNWPRVHKISLDGYRGVRYQEFPQENGRYYQVMEVPRGHGSVSCIAWDSTALTVSRASLLAETNDSEERQLLPLALGSYLRFVQFLLSQNFSALIILPPVTFYRWRFYLTLLFIIQQDC
jgi:hypothetical protein